MRAFVGHRWMRSLSANMITAIMATFSVMGATVLMTRMLGVERLGRVTLLVIVFNAVATLDGIRPVVVIRSSRDRVDDPIPNAAMIIMLLLGMACAVSISLAGIVFDFGYDMTTVVALGVAAGLYFPISAVAGLLEADGGTIYTGSLRNMGWIMTYGGFSLAAWFGAQLMAFALVLLLFQIALLFSYVIRLHWVRPGVFSWSMPSATTIRELATDAVNMIGFNLSALVLGTVDRLALGWIRGFGQMGPYASVYELATRPTAFMRVLAGVSMPELKMMGNSVRIYRTWATVLFGAVTLTAIGTAVVVFFRAQLIEMLLGPRLSGTSDAFGLVAMTLPISLIGYFCITLLSANGDFQSPRYYYSKGAIVIVAAAYPLIAWRGFDGAALLFLLSRWIDLALLRTTLRRFGVAMSARHAFMAAGMALALFVTAFAGPAWLFFLLTGSLLLLAVAILLRLVRYANELSHG